MTAASLLPAARGGRCSLRSQRPYPPNYTRMGGSNPKS